MSGQKNDAIYAATVAFAVATMRELGWMPPSNTSTDPPQDDLIERLRSVKWEVTDDCGRMPDDPTHECVFVDMRPDDFRALLREAAAALEAAREDAARWRHARRILTVEDIESSQDMFDAFGLEGDEHENRKADDAIDQARGKGGGEVEGG